jgi:hypothetical protein
MIAPFTIEVAKVEGGDQLGPRPKPSYMGAASVEINLPRKQHNGGRGSLSRGAKF